MCRDLRNLKESRQVFEKMSNELDNVVQKAAGTPKSKPSEAEEMYNQVTI